MVDYSKLSDADLMALSNNDYASISDEGLKMLSNETQPMRQEQKQGIDLTPSGLIDTAVEGLQAGIETPIRMIKNNQNISDAYKSGFERAKNIREQLKAETPVLSGITDFATDLATYSALPVLRGGGVARAVGNAAIQGGLPMAVEGLKRGENPLTSFGTGTGIGLGIQGALAGLPYVGKVAGLLPKAGGLIAKTVGRVKPETLAQAVKPTSQALDLTEKTAQNLLMNTTEGVQNAYKNLLDKAGLDVQRAALNLPEDRHVFASSLKNSLDDIYSGYSISGDDALNVARNKAGKVYDMISDLIQKSTDENSVISAPKFYDLMENIKKSKINWDEKDANLINGILKQVYGDYARKLGNLSPELRKANKAYSKLAQFDDNEGVRRILNPPKNGDIDSASTALRNYNSTVTKGNTNRNIQDLENILVENNYEPFLNNIDDVNAAMDLLNIRGTGDSWLANLATQATRPALNAIRQANRLGIPEKINNVKEVLTPFAERLLTPLAVKGTAPMLYGNATYYKY